MPEEHDVVEVLELDEVDHVGYVGFEIDFGAGEVHSFAHSGVIEDLAYSTAPLNS